MGGKIPRNFSFLKMKGIYMKGGMEENISDDRGYDADSDMTIVTSGTTKFTKQ